MAEVLVELDANVPGDGGRVYDARVCGRAAEDGLWEGWIEFVPEDGGPVLRTPRETEQHDRADLEYWAAGLTLAYFEGALDRASAPADGVPDRGRDPSAPHYDRASPPADDESPRRAE